jgi:hypothetical protein
VASSHEAREFPRSRQTSVVSIREVVVEAKTHRYAGLAHRAGHELKEFVVISLYLYVCFGAILLYKSSVLEARDITYAPYGVAAIKALILAKFMLIGHAANLGERYRQRPLIYRVLYKSVVFVVFLVVLLVLEEAVSGLIQGRTVVESMRTIAGGTWFQILATSLLLWLILLPYFAVRHIDQVLGEGNLRRMFFVDPASPDQNVRPPVASA